MVKITIAHNIAVIKIRSGTIIVGDTPISSNVPVTKSPIVPGALTTTIKILPIPVNVSLRKV